VIRTETLPSGLSLVTEEMVDARSVAIGFWVGTGSRDEPAARAGASHFLEHLLFKGSASRSAADIAEAVDEVGGDFNAYTTKEYTSFYIRLLAEDLDLGLDILSDIMWEPALAADDLEAERRVILDEILMHTDEPAEEAAEQCTAALFPDHPLGREVLGEEATISTLTAGEVREFFAAHYRPGNIVAGVAGQIVHEQVAGGLERRVRREPGGQGPERTPPGSAVEALRVTRRPTEQAHLVLGCRGFDRHDRRRYAMAVLNHALGGGLSSRLFQEIRERRGLAYSVWSDRMAFDDAGALVVGVGTAPGHVTEVLDVLTDALAVLGDTGITDRELTIAKGNLRAEMLLSNEDSGARMGRIGASLLLHGEVPEVEEVVGRVESVTLDEVRAVAAELTAAPRVLSVVGPFDASDFDAAALGLG